MRPVTILTIALLTASVLSAQTTPEAQPYLQTDARTRAVVDKVVTAYGGGQRLSRVRSIYDVVHTKEATPKGVADVTLSALYVFPDRVWAKVESGRSATMVVLPWSSFVFSPELPNGAAMKMPDDQRDQLMRRMDADPVFVLARRLFASNRFVWRGQRDVAGKKADVLEVKTNGRQSTWIVDPESGRLLTATSGDDVVEYSDWRTVKGLTIPFRTAITKKDGKVQWYVTSACDFDVMYDTALFREPTVWFDPELDLSKSHDWYRWYRAAFGGYSRSFYRY